MNPEIKQLLEGTGLSDDIVSRLQSMVASTVALKVQAIEEECKAKIQQITEKANAYSEYVLAEVKEQTQKEFQEKQDAMVKRVDQYASYVVEKFVKENEQALTEHNEYMRAREVLDRVKRVFEESYFRVEHNSAVVSINEELIAAKKAYKELFAETCQLKEDVSAIKKTAILESACKGLADTQKAKVAGLMSAIQVSGLKEYETSARLMAEQIAKKPSETHETPVQPKTVLTETANRMSDYLKSL